MAHHAALCKWMHQNMETLLTAEDVARLLRVSLRKFEDMIKAGRAPAFVRMGRLRRWEPEVVRVWIRDNRVDHSPKEEEKS